MDSAEREKRRKRFHDYYYAHHDAVLQKILQRRKRNYDLIVRELGEKCAVCGDNEHLLIHHLSYTNRNIMPSFKALKKGQLVLLCRRHHRAAHYINELKRQGYLDTVIKFLNINRQPTFPSTSTHPHG